MKYSLGAVYPMEGGGKYIDLNCAGHTSYGRLVWAMEGDEATPKLQIQARDLVTTLNEADSVETLKAELAELRRLHKLLWSYNPKQPMGDGMAAEFYSTMLNIERAQNVGR